MSASSTTIEVGRLRGKSYQKCEIAENEMGGKKMKAQILIFTG